MLVMLLIYNSKEILLGEVQLIRRKSLRERKRPELRAFLCLNQHGIFPPFKAFLI